MKKYTNKRIEVYVNSDIPGLWNCIRFPEEKLMPIDAVKKIKKLVDDYTKELSTVILCIQTFSSDIVSFVYYYSKVKKYRVQIYYKNKKIGIEGVFKKFNKVFRYTDKVTDVEDKYYEKSSKRN